ncbi:hypothetical protein [Photorhabdus heterorhabditis]|uniref:Uncharacterized protein n=1 Tax=Photorhabdus heterorhabditis TaxID=880156 RepID=A0ABR5KEK9_9GAMM|nr:hypothetical protein [Photorhabdus heterorhabditis]KOY62978.1 hypothetical protein AM629_05295 [Photorhabdus heterorhabditis]
MITLKNFRNIISRVLIEKLGLDAVMLSRLDGNKPVCIELNGGAEIYITYDDDFTLLIFIEIPIKDFRVLQMKSSQVMEVFIADEELHMNVKQKKLVVLTHLDVESKNLDDKLLDKLVSFNIVYEIING